MVSGNAMKQSKRHLIQAAAALLQNANLPGFLSGKIWRGPSKKICVPGLNCYSCPGALGSCPIGSLQAVLGSKGNYVSYYVTGLLLLFGTIFGRLICGFLCPFGLIQDLLHKIPIPKWIVPAKPDKLLRKLKYVILLVFVILMPLFLTDAFGVGAPAFCKYICPAGTLEGGVFLLLANPALRSAVGFLYAWKMVILILTIVLSMLIYRPFCKYLCPLGAFYSLFNKLSFYQMHVDQHSCTHCGMCERVCKMNVPVQTDINAPECIRCGACKEVCPVHAISSGLCKKK